MQIDWESDNKFQLCYASEIYDDGVHQNDEPKARQERDKRYNTIYAHFNSKALKEFKEKSSQ